MSSGAEPGRGLWVDGGLVVAGPGLGGPDSVDVTKRGTDSETFVKYDL